MTAAPKKTKKYSSWDGEFDSLLEVFQSRTYLNFKWLESGLTNLLTTMQLNNGFLPEEKMSTFKEYQDTFSWEQGYCLQRKVYVEAYDSFDETIEFDCLEDAAKALESGDYEDVSDDVIDEHFYDCSPSWSFDDCEVELVITPNNLRLKEVSAA